MGLGSNLQGRGGRHRLHSDLSPQAGRKHKPLKRELKWSTKEVKYLLMVHGPQGTWVLKVAVMEKGLFTPLATLAPERGLENGLSLIPVKLQIHLAM